MMDYPRLNPWNTMKEVASYLRLSLRTVERRIEQGTLQARKDGRLVRIQGEAAQKESGGVSGNGVAKSRHIAAPLLDRISCGQRSRLRSELAGDPARPLHPLVRRRRGCAERGRRGHHRLLYRRGSGDRAAW